MKMNDSYPKIFSYGDEGYGNYWFCGDKISGKSLNENHQRKKKKEERQNGRFFVGTIFSLILFYAVLFIFFPYSFFIMAALMIVVAGWIVFDYFKDKARLKSSN